MKKCLDCGETKSLDLFWKKAKSKDGRDARCGDCARQYHRDIYQKDYRKKQIRRNSKAHVERLLLIRDEFLAGGCVDCGITDKRVLEFDHLGDKAGNVSELIAR